jgi:SNF2 family DNA or RNA helicase
MNILKNRDVMKFLDCLKKLEVIEAVGVANFLKVDLLIREDKENADEQPGATIREKDYEILLSEMIDAFMQCNRNKRKFLLKIMTEATKEDKEENK